MKVNKCIEFIINFTPLSVKKYNLLFKKAVDLFNPFFMEKYAMLHEFESFLCRGQANLPCIIPILVYVRPK